MKMKINPWHDFCLCFQEFFSEYGTVNITAKHAVFTSYPGDVETHFQINSDGFLSASMPLHGINGRIDSVVFDTKQNIVRTSSSEINYEYHIPKEILLRSCDRF
jgi:hypothetical protein